MEVVTPCDVAKTCKHNDKPKDCVLGDWAEWDSCSHSCDSGITTRTRELLSPPSHGGRPCESELTQMEPCNTQPCNGACEAENCVWGEWEDWGACSKCAGQRLRFRHVIQPAKCGGIPCEARDSEETAKCPRKCQSNMFCAWADWADWGECDSKCGTGTRFRRKHLEMVAAPSSISDDISQLDEADMAKQMQALRQRTRGAETRCIQELVLAFAAGGVSLVLLLLGLRLCSSFN